VTSAGRRSPERAATAALAALLAAALAGAAGAVEGEPSASGAYCPLPPPGEKPKCLAPAQARYGEFFAGLEEGTVDPAAAAAVEADLRSQHATQQAYLALSSLSYGYWRLALRAAQMEQVDPQILDQLQRWNELLASTYEDADADPGFRDALRTAAHDLHANTPAAGLECLDEEGNPARCRPTEGLIASIDSLDQELGMRGAIRRVLRRLFGSEGG
jgi:hypothetical protein